MSQNVPEYSRMSRKHAECSRINAKCSRMHAECSGMFQNVPECMHNVPECSRKFQNACRNHAESFRMHAGLTWSSMSLHAVPWACMQLHELPFFVWAAHKNFAVLVFPLSWYLIQQSVSIPNIYQLRHILAGFVSKNNSRIWIRDSRIGSVSYSRFQATFA